MNQISSKQNEEEISSLQYAARNYYNLASRLNLIVWFFCIVNVITAKLPFEFFIQIKTPVIFILLVLTAILQIFTDKQIKIASGMRMCADYKIFDFPKSKEYNGFSELKLKELAAKIICKDPSKALLKFKSTGDSINRGVKNWYVDINPELPQEKAILLCQKQNIWWDKRITSFYNNIIKIAFAIFVLSLVATYFDRSIKELITFFFSLAFLVIKIIMEYNRLKQYNNQMERLEGIWETKPITISADYLLAIQNCIDKRRQMHVIPPDLIHKIKTKKLHEESKYINKISK